ncbi:hypothetical protein BC829DRAFT_410743 [Chytridium lagenaria]|nr:hypothetical protein BC829DRAFT_410743 [Chytridium lagenaria]
MMLASRRVSFATTKEVIQYEMDDEDDEEEEGSGEEEADTDPSSNTTSTKRSSLVTLPRNSSKSTPTTLTSEGWLSTDDETVQIDKLTPRTDAATARRSTSRPPEEEKPKRFPFFGEGGATGSSRVGRASVVVMEMEVEKEKEEKVMVAPPRPRVLVSKSGGLKVNGGNVNVETGGIVNVEMGGGPPRPSPPAGTDTSTQPTTAFSQVMGMIQGLPAASPSHSLQTDYVPNPLPTEPLDDLPGPIPPCAPHAQSNATDLPTPVALPRTGRTMTVKRPNVEDVKVEVEKGLEITIS